MKDRAKHHHRASSAEVSPGSRDRLPPVVIGEDQRRVDFAAKRFSAEGYHWPTAEEAGLPEGSPELEAYRLKDNEKWIRTAIADGRLIIDTGPVEPRVDYPNATRGAHGVPTAQDRPYRNQSPYEMERRVLKSERYQRVISPWSDMSREPWRDPQGQLHMRNFDNAARAKLVERGIDPDTVTQGPWKFDPETYGRTSPEPPRRNEAPTRDER